MPVLIVKSPPKPASVFDPADEMALGSKSPSKPAPHKQGERNNWLDGDKRKVPRLQGHNSILHQGRSTVTGMPEAPREASNAELGRAGTQSPPRVLNMINSNAQGGEEDERSLSSEGSGNFYVSRVWDEPYEPPPTDEEFNMAQKGIIRFGKTWINYVKRLERNDEGNPKMIENEMYQHVQRFRDNMKIIEHYIDVCGRPRTPYRLVFQMIDDVTNHGMPIEAVSSNDFYKLVDEIKSNKSKINSLGATLADGTPKEREDKKDQAEALQRQNNGLKEQIKRYLAWHPGTPHDETILD